MYGWCCSTESSVRNDETVESSNFFGRKQKSWTMLRGITQKRMFLM